MTTEEQLVQSWSRAVDDLLAAGTITEGESEQDRAALEEASGSRVDGDGEEAAPTSAGLAV